MIKIKTTVRAEIDGAVFEYIVELPGTAPWADTLEETAIGLLYDSLDQLSRTLATVDAEPQPTQVTAADGRAIMPPCLTNAHGHCHPFILDGAWNCGCDCHKVGVPAPGQACTGVNYFVQADAIGGERVPVDEYGNRVCYLCGFYHDEPGACATDAPLVNLSPGADEPPEYDGPTMDYMDYVDHDFKATLGLDDAELDNDDCPSA